MVAEVVEYPVQSALEDAPVVLDVLSVDRPPGILNFVVDDLVG